MANLNITAMPNAQCYFVDFVNFVSISFLVFSLPFLVASQEEKMFFLIISFCFIWVSLLLLLLLLSSVAIRFQLLWLNGHDRIGNLLRCIFQP